jgi:hypothetical protein
MHVFAIGVATLCLSFTCGRGFDPPLAAGRRLPIIELAPVRRPAGGAVCS